jgi:CheY-like chemotaxis protein
MSYQMTLATSLHRPSVLLNETPKSETILVVDDDPDAREALSELCRLEGYEAASAENGLVALDEIHGRRVCPALILLDLYMPVMDGHTFLCQARKDSSTANVPIIVMTGDLGAQPSGADAILRKPLKPEFLFQMIRRFLKPSS